LIERAPHATPALVEHVRIDHRRAHIAMTQELLDRTDIVARFEQVGRERVPQRVARRRPCIATGSRGVLDGALDDRFVQVMPSSVRRL
jgi:hypothetical protein